MTTVNDQLLHDAIGHAVDLTRYSNSVVARMIALLNAMDADIVAQIASALERMPAESFSIDRLDQLLASVRSLNAQAYGMLGRELSAEMRKFTAYEANYQHQVMVSTVPTVIELSVGAVNAEQVYTAALARPFQGRLLSEWASSLGESRMVRIRDTLRMGYAENQTVGQMVQRIRGTRAAGYTDAIWQTDRRHVEAVVRTATQHFASETRDRFYDENSDIIKSLKWSATLDSRTSEGCRLRDGLLYEKDAPHSPIGHKVPWLGGPGRLHWNCRSSSVPVLKSAEELGYKAQDVPAGTRASMDGQGPAETTYSQWLKRQSAARQDDILGPTRGKLMRSGDLEMADFYNERGRYLTLDELRARDATAFRKSGL